MGQGQGVTGTVGAHTVMRVLEERQWEQASWMEPFTALESDPGQKHRGVNSAQSPLCEARALRKLVQMRRLSRIHRDG